MFVAVRYKLNSDLIYNVLPWFAQLTEHGLQAISGAYSDYPPTYLYLLATVVPLHGVISDVVLIKSVSVTFMFLAAFIVYWIVFEISMNQCISVVAGAGVLILPTVIMNSAYWGQSDIIYSTLVLGFVLFSLKRAPRRAVLCLGLAFSFKLQTIFIAPFVLYLVLRRRIAWQQLIVIPAVYAVVMLPAWLMGRPVLELAKIYFGQINEYNRLSLSAPNLYQLIQNFQVIDYQVGIRTGVVLAATVGIALAVGAQRLRDNLQADLLVATASVILMPFILPKMHDRYFFLADILTYVLMFAFWRTWPLAVAMQIGSMSAYCRYLFGWRFGPHFGALPVSIAAVGIVWLCFMHARNTARQSHSLLVTR
jgi:Gpi18-like mannosyltransferase